MKLRKTLMMFTAAAALTATVAFAAVDAQALADQYVANGYTYVEVKVGPTETKVEALKGDQYVEVVYSNETGAVISQETQPADPEDVGKTGVEIKTVTEDFDNVDENDDQNADDNDDPNDDQSEDPNDDDDNDDNNDDDDGDDGDDGGEDDGGSNDSDSEGGN